MSPLVAALKFIGSRRPWRVGVADIGSFLGHCGLDSDNELVKSRTVAAATLSANAFRQQNQEPEWFLPRDRKCRDR